MIIKTRDGREVEITFFGRYEDDIQIHSAVYLDDDKDVPSDVVDDIYDDYVDSIYQEWYENNMSRDGDELYDRLREEDL